jgi:D-alanyl-D-alanine carboxypeptidase (penicillin-binding protein 5/6)
VYYYSYRRRQTISPLFIIVPIVLFLGLGLIQMVRPLPAIEPTTDFPPTTVLGQAQQLPLPSEGATIVAVDGLGLIASNRADARRPIASITKMMTAYVILKGHPLAPGERGPTITLTAGDASRYLQMIAQDQSALPVTAGLQMSQYELLQGLLIASANNFAEVLAVWDAGSVTAFVDKMNNEARSLGLTATSYADPSGFSAGSTSTAYDQLALARIAMENPVFAEIVGMRQARLPGIGQISAVNQLLGTDGIVGIKTGFTEEAGGNLAFASQRQAGNLPVTIIGVVLGQTTRPLAFDATRRLLGFLAQSLQPARVVAAGQPVATIKPGWGDTVQIVVAEDVQLLLWPGMTLEASFEFDEVKAPLSAGDQVGWLNLRLGEQERRVALNLAQDLPKAGMIWRLSRI